MLQSRLFLVFAVTLIFLRIAAQAQQDMALKSVGALVAKNSAQVQDLAFEYEYADNWMDAQRPESLVLRPCKARWIYVRNGDKQFHQMMIYRDNSLRELMARKTFSWDGTQSYYWSQEVDPARHKEIGPDGLPQDPGNGGIAEHPQFPPFGPLDFLFQDGRKELAKAVLDPKRAYKIEGMNETVNGRPAILISGPGQKLWFDRERGILLRNAIYGKGATEKPTLLIDILDSKRFGTVWLPVNVRMTHRNIGGEGMVEGIYKILPESVKLNQGEDKYQFKVDFTPGASVMDEKKKTIQNIEAPTQGRN